MDRPLRISTPPNRTTLGQQVARNRATIGGNIGFGGVYGGLRVGYVHYNRRWRDDNFCYPFYVFNPWVPDVFCVASPWYRYSFLPPYINTTRVIIVDNYAPYWGWNNYDVYRYDRTNQANEDLNDALDDLRDAFSRNNERYGDRLVSRAGQVAIYNNGRYDYSLSADDFRDMFLDGIDQTRTIRYEITEVRTRGNEARIRARHEYEDSWGNRQVVFHSYTLARERGDFVIREFGTED